MSLSLSSPVDMSTSPVDRLRSPSAGVADASTYAAAILHCLSEATRTSATIQEAHRLLLQHKTGRCLMELALRLPPPNPEAKARPSSAGPITAYELVIYSQVATTLGQRSLAEFFLGYAQAQAKLSGDIFWEEYARGVDATIAGRPYIAREMGTTCGLEQYWRVYLDLMQAVADGTDVGRAVARTDHAFAARNADAHISQDWFGIEGSARAKVRWDFRKDAILLASTQRQTGPVARYDLVD